MCVYKYTQPFSSLSLRSTCSITRNVLNQRAAYLSLILCLLLQSSNFYLYVAVVQV